MNQKNVKYLMLATADADIMAAGTVISEASDITEGEIAIVDETNTTVVAEQSGKVRVVQRDGDNLIYSPFIDTSKIRRKVSTDGSAAAEQVSYIGYNGSSGALNVVDEGDYIIKGMIKPVTTTMSLFDNVAHWVYRASASASQYEIADGLLKNFNAWKKRSPQKVITADAITATAVDAANDFLGDATVVKGVKSFTVAESVAADDGGEYAAGTAIAVGDFVRIGGVGDGTALTDNVYKVTAVSDVSTAEATITVDRPINNASGTYAAGTSDIEVIPAADIGDMGLKFTGLPLPINPEKWNYEKVRFDLGLVDGFDTTVEVTYDTVADEGVGVEGQIAKMEYQLQMNDGQTWKQAHPAINSRKQYKDVTSYPVNQVVLDVYDDNFKPMLGDVPVSFFTVIIATPNDVAQGKLETVFAI